jgi:hypothetical protein
VDAPSSLVALVRRVVGGYVDVVVSELEVVVSSPGLMSVVTGGLVLVTVWVVVVADVVLTLLDRLGSSM